MSFLRISSQQFLRATFFRCQRYPSIHHTSKSRHALQLNTKTNDDPSYKSQQIPYEVAAKERRVDIYTCGQLFEKWRRDKLYWKVPKGDVTFRVTYIDTDHLDSSNGENPVVLALHGSPGSYQDFSVISSHLHSQEVRVIAPLFPDCQTFKMGRFRHTPEEKTEYVKDFLKEINVPRIDLLMCHSSALFPALLLCLDQQLPINSLCIMNPTAFDYPRVMKPFWLTHLLTRLFEFPGGYHVTEFGGKFLLKFKSQLKGDDYLAHFLSAFTMVHSSIPQRMGLFEKLLQQNFPILLAYSENDKLIARKSLDDMASKMLTETACKRYARFGQLDREGDDNPFRKVLVFENGTHFLYKKYPEILSENISSFLFHHFDNRHP